MRQGFSERVHEVSQLPELEQCEVSRDLLRGAIAAMLAYIEGDSESLEVLCAHLGTRDVVLGLTAVATATMTTDPVPMTPEFLRSRLAILTAMPPEEMRQAMRWDYGGREME